MLEGLREALFIYKTKIGYLLLAACGPAQAAGRPGPGFQPRPQQPAEVTSPQPGEGFQLLTLSTRPPRRQHLFLTLDDGGKALAEPRGKLPGQAGPLPAARCPAPGPGQAASPPS